MSEENATATDVDSEVDAVETEQEVDVKQLQLQVAELQAEAAKQRKLKQQIAKERDELKKSEPVKTPTNDKYKSLYEEAMSKLDAVSKRTQEKEVTLALTERLNKEGIRSDAIKAATKLIDRTLIEFEDGDLDLNSVDSAVKLMRLENSFLFEDKVKPTSSKPPATKVSDGKTMTRAAFDQLNATDKVATVKSGVKIVN